MRYNKHIKYEEVFPRASDKVCIVCSSTLKGKQQKYCSNKCSKRAFHTVMQMRGYSQYLRKALYQRDKGICAECGVDTIKLERIFTHAGHSLSTLKYLDKRDRDFLMFQTLQYFGYKPFRTCWEADHIIELADGGTHDISNLQTLCTKCHKEKSVKNNKKRLDNKR